MAIRGWQHVLGVALIASCATRALAAEPVLFDWFEYRGHDSAFDQPLAPGSFRNPVLAGFHPDPSVVRAGDRFYLVNSSFTYFPGIPVFESTDLVHWKQIGNVIERASQLDFTGLGVSRGVFAPTIEYHDGVFYVINTAVDSGGNFLSTATDPAGPWSDPVWLPSIDGIDPSLFFDADGKVYLLNNGPPPGQPRYDGHRAIWMQEFDLARRQPVGPRKVLLDGGVDPSTNPIWIEGPHIYRRDGWYYLVCAEGGTGPDHSQVVSRSRSPWGPYTPYAGNPILTQRDLDPARVDPVTNAGHADLVEAADGSWWAIFLASRNYGGPHYNTGRETYLLPVTWKQGWPTILEPGRAIPRVLEGPAFLDRAATQTPNSGNFTWRDEFEGPRLDRAWMQLRTPQQVWAALDTVPGQLAIRPLDEGLESLGNPSFLARRQQHLAFEASTSLNLPEAMETEAGIVVFQNEGYWYFLGARRHGEEIQLFLQTSQAGQRSLVAETRIPATQALRLKVSANAGAYSFAYANGSDDYQWLHRDADGTLLSTDVAGGFVGAVMGPYARARKSTTTGGQDAKPD